MSMSSQKYRPTKLQNCHTPTHLLPELFPAYWLAFDPALPVDSGHDLRAGELERIL